MIVGGIPAEPDGCVRQGRGGRGALVVMYLSEALLFTKMICYHSISRDCLFSGLYASLHAGDC